MGEPNENTRGYTGEAVPYTAEYKNRCCAEVKRLNKDDKFPSCGKHGDTDWHWIPPSPDHQAPPQEPPTSYPQDWWGV